MWKKDETCSMAVRNSTGRQRMKHRVLCALVFPVECSVDIKAMRLFWFPSSLLGCFRISSSRCCGFNGADCGWIFTGQTIIKRQIIF